MNTFLVLMLASTSTVPVVRTSTAAEWAYGLRFLDFCSRSGHGFASSRVVPDLGRPRNVQPCRGLQLAPITWRTLATEVGRPELHVVDPSAWRKPTATALGYGGLLAASVGGLYALAAAAAPAGDPKAPYTMTSGVLAGIGVSAIVASIVVTSLPRERADWSEPTEAVRTYNASLLAELELEKAPYRHPMGPATTATTTGLARWNSISGDLLRVARFNEFILERPAVTPRKWRRLRPTRGGRFISWATFFQLVGEEDAGRALFMNRALTVAGYVGGGALVAGGIGLSASGVIPSERDYGRFAGGLAATTVGAVLVAAAYYVLTWDPPRDEVEALAADYNSRLRERHLRATGDEEAVVE